MSRRQRILATTLIITALAAVPAAATVVDDPAELLEADVDLDLEEADVRETLESFGMILQADEVLIDPELRGRVSIRLHDVRVRTVLDALCDSVGCVWRFDDERNLTFGLAPDRETASAGDRSLPPLERLISIELEGADSGQVFRAFAQLLEAELDLGPHVVGPVTVALDNMTVGRALDEICVAQGCEWGLTEDQPPVLRIRASG